MIYFLQGLTMGLAYVAPIGLQNMFVINSALTHTRSRALMTALVVIFFDVTLALACFFGIGVVIKKYAWIQMIILLIGSIIVIFIGVSLLRAKVNDLDISKKEFSFQKTVTTACVVTWFNPQALIDGTMMLGAFQATLPPTQGVTFISGVAVASCLWFLSLSLLLSIFSSKFNVGVLKKINIICGGIVVFYGCKLFFNFIQMLIK